MLGCFLQILTSICCYDVMCFLSRTTHYLENTMNNLENNLNIWVIEQWNPVSKCGLLVEETSSFCKHCLLSVKRKTGHKRGTVCCNGYAEDCSSNSTNMLPIKNTNILITACSVQHLFTFVSRLNQNYKLVILLTIKYGHICRSSY
jgi:hypothetical protein